jgi:hypothetical protein
LHSEKNANVVVGRKELRGEVVVEDAEEKVAAKAGIMVVVVVAGMHRNIALMRDTVHLLHIGDRRKCGLPLRPLLRTVMLRTALQFMAVLLHTLVQHRMEDNLLMVGLHQMEEAYHLAPMAVPTMVVALEAADLLVLQARFLEIG